jgi:hypothetical protein
MFKQVQDINVKNNIKAFDKKNIKMKGATTVLKYEFLNHDDGLDTSGYCVYNILKDRYKMKEEKVMLMAEEVEPVISKEHGLSSNQLLHICQKKDISMYGFDQNKKCFIKHISKNQNYKFYRAIRKYGWDNFEWTVIYQSKNKDHTLNEMESYFIKEYDSFNNGYNSTLGGDGTFGLILSEEARKKISIGNSIPKPQTPEHIRKRTQSRLRNLSLGITQPNKHSEETKQKISQKTKGISKPISKEHKRNLKCHVNNSTKLVCPYCGKEGQHTNIKGKHIPYCKLNPNKNYLQLILMELI